MTKLNQILDTEALAAQVAAGYIRVQTHPQKPNLAIYNYTEKAQFDRAWTPETLTCRGLIVDLPSGEVLARPFQKFFNHDEPEAAGVDFSKRVVVTDKMDGSLGIVYHDGDGWAVATRGSFASEQAIHATRVLRERYAGWEPRAGYTYLFEIVYPENRIVVDYGRNDNLFLLGLVDIQYGETFGTRSGWDWPGPKTESFWFDTFAEAVAEPPRPNAEGYVFHFLDADVRVKFKSEWYKHLHRIVTGWNERTIWELLKDGKAVSDIAENLPDEFHAWATEVAEGLKHERSEIFKAAINEHFGILKELNDEHGEDGWTRRDFALKAKDSEFRPALFAMQDGHTEKVNKWGWDQVRPTATKEATLVG